MSSTTDLERAPHRWRRILSRASSAVMAAGLLLGGYGCSSVTLPTVPQPAPSAPTTTAPAAAPTGTPARPVPLGTAQAVRDQVPVPSSVVEVAGVQDAPAAGTVTGWSALYRVPAPHPVAAVRAFYLQELPVAGWTLAGEQDDAETVTAVRGLDPARPDIGERLQVDLTGDDTGVLVRLLHTATR